MKLKLKVLDPKIKRLTIKDYYEKNIQIVQFDDRWNIEKEFEIPERLILQLIEEIINNISGDNKLHYYDEEKIKSLKKDINSNEINSIIRSARAWKKIHIIISDLGFQTSRFTRLSLFEILLNIPEMKSRLSDKLKDMEDSKKLPEEKIKSELKKTISSPKIQESSFTEFIKEIK